MTTPNKPARVSLVDDNPLILDLMRKGLEPYADISTFTDPSEALRHCVSNPPDLVICDYHMPSLDGRQFVQKLRAGMETRRLPVILLAPQSDISALQSLADSVEEFVAKPFFVRDLTAKARKVLERISSEKERTPASQEGVIRGRLADMNIIDLLQSLELGQKSCALTVTRNSQDCRMFFAAGQLHHAELGPLVGDDVVYCAVSWPDGDFEIDFGARSDKQTTTRSTQALLMEALRLLDEQRRDAE